MSLKLDLVFDAATGDLLDSVGAPRAVSVNAIQAKLQPNLPVRVRLVDRDTGALVAAAGGIEIGFKPLKHYSDAVCDIFTASFNPAGTMGDDLLTYVATAALNGPDLLALFAPNAAGESPDSVDLIGEVVVGGVPTTTFTLRVYNNVIKGDEPPVTPGTARSFGNISLRRLSTPEAPGVTVHGATGTANWKYRIVACLADGTTTDAGPESFSINNGNLTLSAANYNEVSWTPVVGATSYQVYRTGLSSSVTPSTLGKIGTVSAARYLDIGAEGDGSAFPTFNYTGGIAFGGNLLLYANGATLRLRDGAGDETVIAGFPATMPTLAANNVFAGTNEFDGLVTFTDVLSNEDGTFTANQNGDVTLARLLATAGIGAFGVTPPVSKPATPTTLAGVVAVLQGAGFCA